MWCSLSGVFAASGGGMFTISRCPAVRSTRLSIVLSVRSVSIRTQQSTRASPFPLLQLAHPSQRSTRPAPARRSPPRRPPPGLDHTILPIDAKIGRHRGSGRTPEGPGSNACAARRPGNEHAHALAHFTHALRAHGAGSHNIRPKTMQFARARLASVMRPSGCGASCAARDFCWILYCGAMGRAVELIADEGPANRVDRQVAYGMCFVVSTL